MYGICVIVLAIIEVFGHRVFHKLVETCRQVTDRPMTWDRRLIITEIERKEENTKSACAQVCIFAPFIELWSKSSPTTWGAFVRKKMMFELSLNPAKFLALARTRYKVLGSKSLMMYRLSLPAKNIKINDPLSQLHNYFHLEICFLLLNFEK